MRALSLIVALLPGCLWLTACSVSEAAPEAGGAAPPPTPVGVVEVLARDLVPWDDFTGRVESPHDVSVYARVSGYLQSIPRNEGAEVKRGDVLFTIDPRPFRAELLQAESEVARARAQLGLAEREAKRATPLLAEKVITHEDYDTRIAAAAQAKAELHAATAAREVAQLNLTYTEVRAPLDGRISRAIVSLGDYVTGSPVPTLLTTLVSLDPIYVYFDCDEQTYLRYGGKPRSPGPRRSETGLSALVARAGDEGFPYGGVVDFVDNRVEAATGTMRMRARLANPDRTLTPGLFARVRLLGRDKARTLLVDGKAVLTDQDRKYVYVVRDGRATRRIVKLGRTLGHYSVIADGLAEGDQVIVSGLGRVRPDMPVKPEPLTPSEEFADPGAQGAPPSKAPPSKAPPSPRAPSPERPR